MPDFYPPVGFHFRVEVLDLPPNENDARFSDVGGLTAEVGTEEVAEGGETRFIQKYPLRAKYSELVLKRGLYVGSELLNWVQECLGSDTVAPKNIDVMLLNQEHEPLLAWHVVKAFPTKWSVSDLNAKSNSVVIETLQFSYQYFRLDKS
jgi:phage tail-like protein